VLSISVFSFVFSCKKRTQKSLSRLLVINIYHPQNKFSAHILNQNQISIKLSRTFIFSILDSKSISLSVMS